MDGTGAVAVSLSQTAVFSAMSSPIWVNLLLELCRQSTDFFMTGTLGPSPTPFSPPTLPFLRRLTY